MFFSRRKKQIFISQENRAFSSHGNLDFEMLYETYVERIYAYCLRRVGQTEEAEDLASMIFTRAWANLGGYRGGSEAAWLFKIAHNTVANHLRARKPQVSLEVLVVAGGENFADGYGEELLENLIRRENWTELAAQIEKLTPDQRELLALSIAGGLSAREVGEVLGKSEAAVWMAFHRIVKKLRRNLAVQNEPEKENTR